MNDITEAQITSHQQAVINELTLVHRRVYFLEQVEKMQRLLADSYREINELCHRYQKLKRAFLHANIGQPIADYFTEAEVADLGLIELYRHIDSVNLPMLDEKIVTTTALSHLLTAQQDQLVLTLLGDNDPMSKGDVYVAVRDQLKRGFTDTLHTLSQVCDKHAMDANRTKTVKGFFEHLLRGLKSLLFHGKAFSHKKNDCSADYMTITRHDEALNGVNGKLANSFFQVGVVGSKIRLSIPEKITAFGEKQPASFVEEMTRV